MTTHVCLVSEQAAANLLPALDLSLKPARAVLVVTERMHERADHLEMVLRESGVAVERLSLSNEHDFHLTQNELLDWAARQSDTNIQLNITGGTKLMSLAAQRVAEQAGWALFYVDADNDRVAWLDQEPRNDHQLAEQLRLPHYLSGYGFKCTRPEVPAINAERRQLVDELILQIGSLEQPLAQLNWLAQQVDDRKCLDMELDRRQQDNRHLEAILRKFENAGLLTVEGARVRFAGTQALKFVHGGWLEAHAFRTLAQLANDMNIRDKAANLEVVDAKQVKNELDIAFMARNRLHIVECKTARMDKPVAPKANDALFKLSELGRRIGGLGTRCLLLSYRGLADSERRLANALGIELICGTDLQRLGEHLRRWVQR